MTRCLPLFVATAVLALPAIAHADVDVQFSAGVTTASGATAARIEQELEAATNAALRRMADDPTDSPTRAAARRLRDVNQVLRIMCREEAQHDPTLQDLYEQSEVSGSAGGAATRGAFDAAGNPIAGGTIIMVIECARLQPPTGWYGGFGVDNSDSMTRVLGHELLHASSRGFRHNDDNNADEELYDPFAERFRRAYGEVLEDVRRAIRQAERRRKQQERADQRKEEREKKKGTHKSDPKVPPSDCPPEEH